jgi:choline dehydrogenase
LHIETDAQVSRIEFSAQTAEAIVYEKDGAPHRVRARREIILSAGSIGTPHVLQLSGVGPAGLLQSHGVKVVHDLPGVGGNLSDHIGARRVYATSSRNTINAMMRSRFSQGLAGLEYLLNRSGPPSIGAALAGGYASTEPGLDAPDIQMFFIPFNADSYSGALPPTSSFQIIGYRNHPESRGNVTLQSPDPRQAPKIVANYFSAEKDIATTIATLRLIDRIGKAEPLRKLDVVQIEPVAGTDSDAELEAHIRETATTGFHQVGTCRMGTDDLAVVDPALKVRGMEKLRIADGSVMPTLISGNTNSVCIMIGEKCTDLIRNRM